MKIDDYYFLTYASRPFAPGQYWREDKEYFGFQPKAGPKTIIYNDTQTHLAVSKDLINWKKLGRITDSRFDDRDVIIFPERVNGKYVKISRAMDKCGKGYENENPAMWISFSNDLLEWREEETLLYQGKEDWEDAKVGGSCPPIKIIARNRKAQSLFKKSRFLINLEYRNAVAARNRAHEKLVIG